jgi:hypothetical protein
VDCESNGFDVDRHWRKHGLPEYAQFDNDTILQGAHQWPDSFGRVIRLCLQLGVVTVFAPPRETGFQGAVESYNGRWQAKVWRRFEHDNLRALQRRSDEYVEASRIRTAARRMPCRPAKRSQKWKLDLQSPLQGTVIFLRRTNNQGTVELLGPSYHVDSTWPNCLIRAEVNLSRGEIHFYRLRRREPNIQTLAIRVPYATPKKKFNE